MEDRQRQENEEDSTGIVAFGLWKAQSGRKEEEKDEDEEEEEERTTLEE